LRLRALAVKGFNLMSRVGNKPIPLPKGVTISVGEQLQVEGPKGKLTVPIPAGIKIKQENGIVQIARDGDEQAALHGLTRALAANAVNGVSTGFTRELDIVGIGFRADVKGRIATFTLGYSHPIEVLLPDGVDLKIDKQTHLVLTSFDKQLLGQTAANIRALRKPDPYKNKGIRYTGEVLRKKVGKTGATGAKA
jgi:large subunit ribosomal protein L6